MSYASGDVLEGCVGDNQNDIYLNRTDISKRFIVDWNKNLETTLENTISANTFLIIEDVHKMEFKDEIFDTVIDTFGLECTYDPAKAYSEYKRVLKPGGKMILMERGIGVWLF